jgi:hypothetical protein
MVLSFQCQMIISFKGLSCLQLGHLILIIHKVEVAKSKPKIIPKRRVSKIVSIFFIIEPLTYQYWPEHPVSVKGH